jgi:hypothetical protein
VILVVGSESVASLEWKKERRRLTSKKERATSPILIGFEKWANGNA